MRRAGIDGDNEGPGTAADRALLDVLDASLATPAGISLADLDQLAIAHPALAERLPETVSVLQFLRQAAQGEAFAAADPWLPKSSQQLGDFKILRAIGRGGMGVVYEAEQVSLGRRVALKTLPFAGALDARKIQRFRNEAAAAAQLRHPHIVPIHAVDCDQGVHYYAMQLVVGRSLAEVIAELREGLRTSRRGGRGQSAALLLGGDAAARAAATARGLVLDRGYFLALARLGSEAAGALDHAHDSGVVHRDVKPSNLLLGDDGKLWVTDFGLAKVAGAVGVTISGDVVGTLRYMAPEQALGKRGLADHRADVYSLGATLYELATLQPLFRDDDRATLLRRIAQADPRMPRRARSEVPADFETILLKALAKDPRERYQTARELADDLHRFATGQTILARRASPVRRAWQWARRERAKAALLIALGLGVPSLAGLGGWVVAAQPKLRVVAEQARQEQIEMLLAQGYLESDWWGTRSMAPTPAALEDALRIDPDNLEVIAGIAMAHLIRKQGHEALAVLNRYPGAAVLDRLRVDALHLAGQADAANQLEAQLREPATSFEAQLEARRCFSRGRRGSPKDRSSAINWSVHALIAGFRPRLVTVGMVGSAAAKSGNTKLARGCADAILAAWPDQPVASCIAALILAEHVDAPAAVAILRRCADNEPNNASIHSWLGTALHASGNLREAIAAYNQALALDPDGDVTLCGLGVALLDCGDVDASIAVLRRACEVGHGWPLADATLNLAYAMDKRGDKASCLALTRRAVELEPNLVGGQFYLGLALSKAGDYPGAIAAYRRSLDINPKYKRSLIELGVALGQSGDLPGAIDAFKKALEIDERQSRAHACLGEALHKFGDLSGAIDALRRATKLEPNNLESQSYLGFVLAEARDYSGAIAAYQRCLEIDPHHVDSQIEIGLTLRKSGDLPGAIDAYKKALGIDERQSRAHLNLGSALAEAGDSRAATAALRRATVLDPKAGKAFYMLGWLLYNAGEFEDAVTACAQAAALVPTLPQVHTHYGDALLKVGEVAEALQAYRTAVDKDPSDAQAWNQLAWIQIDPAGDPSLRNQGAALTAAKKAVELSQRRDSASLDTLAEALFATGDIAAAVATQVEALAVLASQPQPDAAERAFLEASLARYRAALPR